MVLGLDVQPNSWIRANVRLKADGNASRLREAGPFRVLKVTRGESMDLLEIATRRNRTGEDPKYTELQNAVDEVNGYKLVSIIRRDPPKKRES